MRDRISPRASMCMGPVLGLIALAGCTVGPDFRPPVAALPPTWQGAPPSVAVAEDAPWWRAFDDPVLDALEARAGSASLDVAMAAERVTAARIARGATRAATMPLVTGQAAYSRERAGTAGLSEITGTLLGITPAAQSPKGVDFDLYSVGIGASWDLDLWGGQRRQAEAAQATVAATAAALRGVRLSVETEVARTWFQVRGLWDERRLAGDRLTIATRRLAIARTLKDRGLASAIDLAQADEAQRAVRDEIAEIDRQAAAAARALAVLVGDNPDTPPAEQTAARAPIRLAPAATRLPSDVARLRPDIVEAEARLHAATAEIGVAQADFYPKISLTGMFSLDVLNLADLGWDARSTSIGPGLSLPIFDGGRLRRKLDLRRSEQRSAALAYRQTVVNAWREVDDALSATHTLATRAALADADVASRHASLAMVEARFRRGDVGAVALLDARQAALAAETASLRQRVASALAQVQLRRTLGG